MSYDKELVANKLLRWEKYINEYHLPKWEEIPNFGLYMEQVIEVMKQYLDYLPPELREEQSITAPTINNYVRKKVMPEPRKKMYYREHLAYLLIILSLKQSLSIAMIQKILPVDLEEGELENLYKGFVSRHDKAACQFANEVRRISGKIIGTDNPDENAVENTEELIMTMAINCGLSKVLVEKLVLLDN